MPGRAADATKAATSGSVAVSVNISMDVVCVRGPASGSRNHPASTQNQMRDTFSISRVFKTISLLLKHKGFRSCAGARLSEPFKSTLTR